MLGSQLSTNISAICQLSGYFVDLRSKLSAENNASPLIADNSNFDQFSGYSYTHQDTNVQDQLNPSIV